MARRSKIIRKQPLSQRLSTLPFDLWLSISENIEVFDWDAQALPIALPAGLGCNVLLLLSRAYSSFNKQNEDELFSNNDREVFNVPKRRPLLTVIFSTLTLVLVSLCFGNAIYCYRKTRKYTLMGRSVDNTPGTPSAQRVRYFDSNTEPESPIKKLFKWKKEEDEKNNGDDLWELNIWNPPKFCLCLASTFSPLHAFTIMYAPMGMFLLFMLMFLSVYLFGTTWKFLTMVKDRNILHSEVMGEYGKKVVQPVVYTKKRDVAVGSDGTVDTFSPAALSRYVERDVRESKAPKLNLNETPWKEAPPPSPAPRLSLGGIPPSLSHSLRQRASMNSVNSMNSLRTNSMTTNAESQTPSISTTSKKSRKSSIRPWHREPDYAASPLSRKS